MQDCREVNIGDRYWSLQAAFSSRRDDRLHSERYAMQSPKIFPDRAQAVERLFQSTTGTSIGATAISSRQFDYHFGFGNRGRRLVAGGLARLHSAV
jgi:hypothetical protein